jgi:hypothetical protein
VPVYEKIGKAFADNDSVVITKFDATANDIPDTKKFQACMASPLRMASPFAGRCTTLRMLCSVFYVHGSSPCCFQ